MITEMHLHAIIERKISEMAKSPIPLNKSYRITTDKSGRMTIEKTNTAPPHVKMKQRKSKKTKPTRRVKGAQRP